MGSKLERPPSKCEHTALHSRPDNDAALELYPVSYTTSGYGTNGQPGYVAANSWFTATGTTTSDGTAQAASRQGLTISETTAPFGIANSKNYYVFSKFVIGLASGSALATEGLQADVTFTATGNSSFNDCLSVWIVYDTTGFPTAPTSGTTTQKFVFEDADASGVVHSSDLQDVTLEDPIYVKVYAFFDGDNEACTTNNAVSLDDISIEIEFTVNEALHGAQQNP